MYKNYEGKMIRLRNLGVGSYSDSNLDLVNTLVGCYNYTKFGKIYTIHNRYVSKKTSKNNIE